MLDLQVGRHWVRTRYARPRPSSFPYQATKDDAVKWPISAIHSRDCTSLIAPQPDGSHRPGDSTRSCALCLTCDYCVLPCTEHQRWRAGCRPSRPRGGPFGSQVVSLSGSMSSSSAGTSTATGRWNQHVPHRRWSASPLLSRLRASNLSMYNCRRSTCRELRELRDLYGGEQETRNALGFVDRTKAPWAGRAKICLGSPRQPLNVQKSKVAELGEWKVGWPVSRRLPSRS